MYNGSNTADIYLYLPHLRANWDDPEGWDGVGGGFRVGNTYTLKADSCQCMEKITTIF